MNHDSPWLWTFAVTGILAFGCGDEPPPSSNAASTTGVTSVSSSAQTGGMGGMGGETASGGSGGSGGTAEKPLPPTREPVAEGKIRYAKAAPLEGQQVVNDVATDDKGNLIVVGSFTGSIDLGDTEPLKSNGGRDIFIAMLDPMGGHKWSRSFGSTGNDSARVVRYSSTLSGGRIVMAGHYEGSFDVGPQTLASSMAQGLFLTAIDPMDGMPQWTNAYASESKDATVRALAVNPAGSTIAMSGHLTGNLVFGGQNKTNTYVHFLDPMGGHKEVDALTQSNDRIDSIVFDQAGNLWMSGICGMTQGQGEACHGYRSFDGKGATWFWLGSQGMVSVGRFRQLAVNPVDGRVWTAGAYEGSIRLCHLRRGVMGEAPAKQDITIALQGNDLSSAATVTGFSFDPWGKAILAASYKAGNLPGTIASQTIQAPTPKGSTDHLLVKLSLADEGVVSPWYRQLGSDKADEVLSLDTNAWGETMLGGQFEGTFSWDNKTFTGQSSDAFFGSYAP